MKRFLQIVFFVWFSCTAEAQTDSNAIGKGDSAVPIKQPARQQPKRIIPKPSLPADTIASIAKDSTLLQDSVGATVPSENRSDTLAAAKPSPKKFEGIDSFYAHFLRNPFIADTAKPVFQIMNVRVARQKDDLFYLVAGLVFMLAFIKLFFSKYFSNIFRLFFQPSFRQKQTREQLIQNSLPSLLLNLFFLFSAGIYCALLIQYHGLIELSFWLLFLYCVLGLMVLYLGKYFLLSFSGWVFNVREASTTYIFVVNLINKIFGVLLLPFIFAIAFSTNTIADMAVTLSMLLVVVLFAYRFVVSYTPVRREVSVSALHFAMYVVAFEVIPLLLIYKALILFLMRTH